MEIRVVTSFFFFGRNCLTHKAENNFKRRDVILTNVYICKNSVNELAEYLSWFLHNCIVIFWTSTKIKSTLFIILTLSILKYKINIQSLSQQHVKHCFFFPFQKSSKRNNNWFPALVTNIVPILLSLHSSLVQFYEVLKIVQFCYTFMFEIH